MIIEILGFACLGHMAADLLQHFKADILKEKPFSCDMCMAFWISIGPLLAQYGLKGIPMAAVSAVLADIIFRLKQRL